MKLLFLHGWGFDARLWDGVRRALAPMPSIAWDRGYFGPARAEPAGEPAIAIGHSLGGLILAADPPADCIGSIVVNGFDRFAGEDAVPRRTIDRMRRRFAETPAVVLNDFRRRCGDAPIPDAMDAARLAADLDLLATGDARGSARPLLMLHGDADPILPPALRASAFPDAPRETLAGGGHLLPLTHPQWCADHIRAALA